MKYVCNLLAVKDIKKSVKFYQELFDLAVITDYGINVAFSCGIALQQEFDSIIGVEKESMIFKPHSSELCFEEENFDDFLEKLKRFPDIKYFGEVVEHSWGQRTIHFYDPDKHLIEVGESMKIVINRFLSNGLTKEQTAKKMDVSLNDLETLLD